MTDHDRPAGEDGGPYGIDPGIIFASIREYSLRPKRKRRALACLGYLVVLWAAFWFVTDVPEFFKYLGIFAGFYLAIYVVRVSARWLRARLGL
jgi:hypothetical protein